jgi:cardiolipin synthase
VQVVAYRPFRLSRWHLSFLRRFFQAFNRRNHRKLAVIDDRISYFGGMNLLDVGGSASNEWSKTNPYPAQAWRDVHVRLEGEATEEVARAFMALRPEYRHQIKHVHHTNNSVREMLLMKPDSILFVDSRPRMKYRRPAPIFRALLRTAKSQIRLAMAYFLPFGGVLKELRRAHRRKVNVEVIVPIVSDVPLVQWATQHMYQRLLQSGVVIYERNDRMLHSKAMVIDRHLSVVGSCNFDPRSFLLNLEFFAVIRSTAFADHLLAILDTEIENSQQVSLQTHLQRSGFRRLLHWFAWRFRRWL